MPSARIIVIGSSGSGKSTLGRALRDRCGYALLELDGVHHLPGWTQKPEAEARAEIEAFIDREPRWVIDGNYTRYRDLTWSAADTIVWLDLPRPVVMASLLRRTLRRVITREELWNGNRESLRNALSLDPQRSVLVWSFTRFQMYQDEYSELMGSPSWKALHWIRLRTRDDVNGYLRAQGSTAPAAQPSAGRGSPR